MPPDKDYYAKEFLSVSGENGKHARQGGFLRERPLPTPFQSTPQFYDANFAIDVERAARIGIDGFGVNLLSLTDKTFMPAARKLLDAAVASSTGFKIFPEPDMTTLSGLTPLGLADTLMLFATHPGALRIDGKLLVMPIAAEKYPVAFWQQFTTIMSQRGYPIALMPCYYDPAINTMAKYRNISWGAAFWGTRGPSAGNNAAEVIAEIKKLGYSHWMIPVSPQDSRPKDLLSFEAGNSRSYKNQWDAAIALGAKQVQIVTWNDYSETSEISPSSFTKFAFYDLTAYYTAWIKAGSPPPLSRDAFYFVQRRQIFRPDKLIQGARWSLAGNPPWSNDIEVVALLTKPGELVLKSGDSTVRKMAGAGLQTIRVPASAGTATFALKRGHRIIARITSPISIDPNPDRHDPTYGGSSSLRLGRNNNGG
nr:endo-1,3-alpha-glucanase family glycosylhydrolase [Sphingomonas paucimobilis]